MPVLALEHIRPMRGGAQSQLLRANDSYYYVVKFTNNAQHLRVLANEFLASRLARLLHLPVPEVEIVNVPRILVERCPEMVVRLSGREQPCAHGLQFGSRLVARDPESAMYDYLPEAVLGMVRNIADFAGMLAFDKWTCNCNGRQVVFCRPNPRRRLEVHMIDQGFCFNGGEWDFPDSPLRGVYSRNSVYRDITGWEDFEPWLSRLEALDPDLIFQPSAEIPPAWYGDPGELERLLQQLVKRRSRVRDLIVQVRDSPRAPFPLWAQRTAIALGA